MARKSKGWVKLDGDLLDDPDYRKLSPSAKNVYTYLKYSFEYKNGLELSLKYEDMADQMGSNAFSSALHQLMGEENKGTKNKVKWVECRAKFIQKIKGGGLFKGKTKYKLIGKHSSFYYRGRPLE